MAYIEQHLLRYLLRGRGFRQGFVETSRGRVFTMEAEGHGALPPIVLLHGASSCGAHYAQLMQHLRPHVRRLVTLDMLGHGFSDDAVLDTAAATSVFLEAMERVVNEPMVVFGTSLGGFGALRFALSRPAFVRALVLVSPAGAMMDDAELAALKADLSMDTLAQALRFVDRIFERPPRWRRVMAVNVKKRFQQPALAYLLQTLSKRDLFDAAEIASIAVPTLLVWGKAEKILPKSNLRFFKLHAPRQMTIIEPEGYGHAPFLDRAPSVAENVLSFLRGLPMDGERV